MFWLPQAYALLDVGSGLESNRNSDEFSDLFPRAPVRTELKLPTANCEKTMKDEAEILQRLKDGNARFVADKLDGSLQDSARRSSLTSGQDPYAIILSCADSRVVPELAFDTGLGELFVVRVAGNVANTSSIASIEYAVAHIGCAVLVVLGHESCGAVTAAIAGGDNGENLNHLLGHVGPAIKAVGDGASVDDTVRKHAQLTVDELKAQSKIIGDAVEAGKLQVVPAYYNLGSGQVDFL